MAGDTWGSFGWWRGVPESEGAPITESNGIGLLNESSLHRALKERYAGPGALVEAVVDGYVVDVVRADDLVEVQTSTFSAIRDKLRALLESHRVRLVYPIAARSWIVRVAPETGELLGRRRSPKRGAPLEVFHELVYVPDLFMTPGFSLDLVLIEQEEVRCPDGRGSWRRRGMSVVDRRLLRVVDTRTIRCGRDLLALLPHTLAGPFTNRTLAAEAGIPRRLAQRVTYTLRRCGALDEAGKAGREPLFVPAREGAAYGDAVASGTDAPSASSSAGPREEDTG